MTTLEIIGTVTGLIHLVLLTREKISAWIFGIICVAIFAYVLYHQQLYSDAILNAIYIPLNIYGWYNWSRRKKETSTVHVSRLSSNAIGIVIAIILSGTIAWGYFMASQTDADFPFIDAFTTVASLTAQFLLTQKKIDNWVIWIIVNLVTIPLYYYKGLYFFSGLFVVYLVLCISGLLEWRKQLKTQIA